MPVDDFSGAAANLADPPWFVVRNGPPRNMALDGSGHALPAVDGEEPLVYRDDDTFSDDQYSQLVVLFSGPGDGTKYIELTVRHSGSFTGLNDQGYVFYSDGGSDSAIELKLAGSLTALSGGTARDDAIVFSSGDVLRMEAVGDDIVVYRNGTVILSATDTSAISGAPGFGMYADDASTTLVDNWAGGDIVGGSHVLTGRGVTDIASPAYLSIALSGIPTNVSIGNAEPPNWYHVGMISWGTDNGAMTAYPVTRELDLVAVPAGMTKLWYQFAAATVAIVSELAGP